MPVTSIFFFSHNVYYPLQNKFQSFSQLCFYPLYMISVWTRLTCCHLVRDFLPNDKIKDLSRIKTQSFHQLCFYPPHMLSVWTRLKSCCLVIIIWIKVIVTCMMGLSLTRYKNRTTCVCQTLMPPPPQPFFFLNTTICGCQCLAVAVFYLNALPYDRF